MKEDKESFRISNSLVNNSSSKLQKVIYQSASKPSFGYTKKWWCWYQVFCFPFFELPGSQKEPPATRTVIQQHQIYHQQKVTQVLRKCASNASIFLEFLPQYKEYLYQYLYRESIQDLKSLKISLRFKTR